MLRRVLLLSALLPSAVWADWGTYQGNAGHTGYVPTTLDLGQLSQLWFRTPVPAAAYSGIAVGNGKLYASRSSYSVAGGLYALDISDGLERWRVEFAEDFSVNPPALDGSSVYFQTGQGYHDAPFFRSYDATTGAFRFKSAFGAQWETYLAPVIANGTAYMNAGYYGGMYAFDTANGVQRWFCDALPQYDQWSPGLTATHMITYLGASFSNAGNAGIYAVNRTTGAVDYRVTDADYTWGGWSMGQAVAMDGSSCYVTNGMRLIKFDLTGKKIAWQKTRQFYGQVTVGPNAVYALDHGGITASDRATGNFLWMLESSHGAFMGPLIVTDRNLIAQSQTHTMVFDLASRQEVWSYPVVGPMALDNGVLYVAGETIRAFKVGAPHFFLGLTLSKSVVAGANSVLATVIMNNPARRAEFVRLWDNTTLIATPSGVTVAVGQQEASARLVTVPVAVWATRTIFASFGGITKSVDVQLKPYGPSAIQLQPGNVRGGDSFSGKIVMNGPAPSNGQLVQFSTDSPNAQVQTSVQIPPGSTYTYFYGQTSPTPAMQAVRITARVKGVSAGATLTIRP